MFLSTVLPSPELAAVVGPGPMTRHELGKRLWEYIGARNLHDPSDRKVIHADDTLQAVFNRHRRLAVMCCGCVWHWTPVK